MTHDPTPTPEDLAAWRLATLRWRVDSGGGVEWQAPLLCALHYKARAEEAEAEVARLRSLLARAESEGG